MRRAIVSGVAHRLEDWVRRGPARWRAAVAACALLVSLLVPTGAASAEENGVKVGSGRLHPSIEIGGEYDSRAKVEFGTGDSIGGFLLHLKPALTFDNGSREVAFSLRASGDANIYPMRQTRNLTYFGGDVDLSLDINPRGTVGVVLEDRFAHSDRNSAVAIGSGVRSIFNEAAVSLPIRPGGGALEIIPSYALQLEAFMTVLGETTGVGQPRELNYLSHRPNLQARWRFLPKTAVVLDVLGDYRQYFEPGVGGSNLWGFYAKAGLSGLITPKLSLVVNAGYGRSFLIDPAYNSVIGQAELTFIPNTFTRIKLGYARTFMPVPQLIWFGDNRVYGGGSVLLGGRLLFDFEGSFDLVNYATGRIDTVIGLDLGLRVRITEWMEAGGGYRLDIRGSSDAGSAYQRHLVGAMVNLRY
ncbi:MAG: outer membrane beta-barrel protein [Deltaproteobacteria bacterium]|nr:outer membrane beta-barrel protein [Deltaproteobacteria bacterium]